MRYDAADHTPIRVVCGSPINHDIRILIQIYFGETKRNHACPGLKSVSHSLEFGGSSDVISSIVKGEAYIATVSAAFSRNQFLTPCLVNRHLRAPM